MGPWVEGLVGQWGWLVGPQGTWLPGWEVGGLKVTQSDRESRKSTATVMGRTAGLSQTWGYAPNMYRNLVDQTNLLLI